jgi:imidazolonepropionase-like amidohydrolase
MTHEYIIALNGHIEPDPGGDAEETALAWAADAILAVGPDQVVRAISRGDSTFLDLGGCLVTPLPDAPSHADSLVREEQIGAADIARRLVESGLLSANAALEPGSPADLAFWDESGLVAIVRAGHFTDGDERSGPFPRVTPGS